jgi:hypothetical protein
MSNADTHARHGQYLNLPDRRTAALELQEVLSLRSGYHSSRKPCFGASLAPDGDIDHIPRQVVGFARPQTSHPHPVTNQWVGFVG